MMLNNLKPIRVLLLGFGQSGKYIHYPLISSNSNFQIIGICKKSGINFADYSKIYDEIEFYDSIDKVLRDSHKFDLAVVATPNITHLTYANLLLENGLDLVIEKPVAGNEKQTYEIFQKARLFDKTIYVFQNRRWDSDYLTLSKLLRTNPIGDLLSVESNWQNLKEARTTWRNSNNPEELGGIVLDLGPHLVDQMIQLLGPVNEVSAKIDTIRPNAETDDAMRIEMLHSNGIKSVISASHCEERISPRFVAKGSTGKIILNEYDEQELKLKSRKTLNHNYSSQEIRTPIAAVSFYNKGNESSLKVGYENGLWSTFYDKVYESMKNNRPFPIKEDQIVYYNRILDLARKSSKLNTIIHL
jgi:scyllo-inositol 2-dehydrogenase (NADP+)